MEEGVKLDDRRVCCCCCSFEVLFDDDDDNKFENWIIVDGGERDVVWVDCTEHIGFVCLTGVDNESLLFDKEIFFE